MKPDRAGLDALLRACIQCGLCLPHCATYVATGDERLSPRGRLLLLRRLLDGEPDATDPSVLASFDLCLGCDACAGVCPSGIDPVLLERAREVALAAAPATAAVRLVAGRRRLGLVAAAGRRARGAARLLWGPGWRSRAASAPGPVGRAARLLGSLPRCPESDAAMVRLLERLLNARDSGPVPAPPLTLSPPRGPVIALFSGCADAALLPGTASRLERLLAAGGCRILPAPEIGCCGALDRHAGRLGAADRHRRRNHAVLGRLVEPAAALVVAAAGCGRELRRYPGPVGAKTVDALALLCRLTLPPPRPIPLRVALHDPCHALHGQEIDREPRRLLAAIPGLVLLQPEEREVCCGAAGPYALRHPELSARIGRRKARALAATGADLAVTANVGCLGQLQDGLAEQGIELPVLPLTDLLWFAHASALENVSGG